MWCVRKVEASAVGLLISEAPVTFFLEDKDTGAQAVEVIQAVYSDGSFDQTDAMQQLEALGYDPNDFGVVAP